MKVSTINFQDSTTSKLYFTYGSTLSFFQLISHFTFFLFFFFYMGNASTKKKGGMEDAEVVLYLHQRNN